MIAIFDLDGTLALNEHRQHFLKETPKNWKDFNAACVDDKPNLPLIQLYQDLEHTNIVYILSGRTRDVIFQTRAWLDDNDIKITPKTLKMRESGDFRDDRIVKGELFDEILKEKGRAYAINPSRDIIIFDDRQKVVDMWREMGLTCCQVAPGNF